MYVYICMNIWYINICIYIYIYIGLVVFVFLDAIQVMPSCGHPKVAIRRKMHSYIAVTLVGGCYNRVERERKLDGTSFRPVHREFATTNTAADLVPDPATR